MKNLEREWILWIKHSEGSVDKPGFNWRFEGELKLDLLCTTYYPLESTPFFEFARFIDQLDLARMILKDHTDSYVEFAVQSILKYGEFIDAYLIIGSTEELEDYCKKSLLPLPRGYKEAWQSCINYQQANPRISS